MKNHRTLVKLYSIIGISLVFFAIFAFATPHNLKSTKKLIVTSKDQATFDFCLIGEQFENGREDFLNQTTPFEMDINVADCKILLKKISGDSFVRFKVEGRGGTLEATWPTTVIIIKGETMETFGL